MLKQHPNVPELQAQMNEVQSLLNDIRKGMAEHPEAEYREYWEYWEYWYASRVILVFVCLNKQMNSI